MHPETNAAISEHAVNALQTGELIEDCFEGDDFRLMVVANKFQTGFDQPLLAGMFLDKPVLDRNAVQTVSRLNRCHHGKKDVVVVDFTNNACGRYDELADPKYTDIGGIFDIMAVTVIQTHLSAGAGA